ncbi:unnamed protein product [Rotaria sp. Silwood1]|nr:unnamed protein product [Rotaria sp. Silwood1]CAF5126393.1 unnamed protein product [Rotaria sp. Silwood1]
MHITPHGTTTFSPFQIMFGRENLLLMDPQQMKVSLSKPNQYYEKEPSTFIVKIEDPDSDHNPNYTKQVITSDMKPIFIREDCE